MFPIKWLSILPKILGPVAIMFAIYTGYAYTKHLGYEEATTKCEETFKKYEETLDKKINIIENLSTELVLENKVASAALAADISTILKNTKTKPLVIVKNGECTPSKDFSDGIVQINERVNKSIKDNQK